MRLDPLGSTLQRPPGRLRAQEAIDVMMLSFNGRK